MPGKPPAQRLMPLGHILKYLLCGNGVGNAGIMLDPHDEDELKHAIQELWSNPETRKKLRQKGLQQAQQFTWKKTGEQTIRVYQKTLEKWEQ